MTTQAIYVHWPFCVSKCPYCDFNSHVRETVDQAAWVEALCTEVRYWRNRFEGDATSIFFGGGTPSLMPPGTVEAVIDAVTDSFGLADGCEITLEANPSTVEAGRFRDFRSAGINRLSLGVQSFDDQALRFLGRAHDASAALSAIELARSTFDRFTFDLIYALPGQTEADWRAALGRAIDLCAGHLSLYQLTIEPNTGFAGAVRRGAIVPMDDDIAADLFEVTQDVCAGAGLPAYETSNHARPGQESHHNLSYWRYQSWIGIGPGAHGRPRDPEGNRYATSNWKKPERWLQSVMATDGACEEFRKLDRQERAEEALMMGLRLTEGIDLAAFHRATGSQVSDLVDAAAADTMSAQGLIEQTDQCLRLLPDGKLLLNRITAELLRDGAL